jgi:predicted SprT family Zn-dependent metalloprotease
MWQDPAMDTEYFFYANTQKGTLAFICKSCQSTVNDRNRKKKRAIRLCNVCGNKMDIHSFSIIRIDAIGRVTRKFVCNKCEGGFIHA